MKKFTDLYAWQKGHSLILKTYKITDFFPEKEKFGLVSQIRRSAVSITSNIAEGFSRRTYKDKIYFYYISLGSLTELQNQLLIAIDLGYVSIDEFNVIASESVDVNKLINGLIKASRDKIHDS
uniref:Four helix bundle protein n=1 Tax=candidate division CPR3 bacterium TaxID=2268181 RepID=A0A7C4R214_UNCC3